LGGEGDSGAVDRSGFSPEIWYRRAWLTEREVEPVLAAITNQVLVDYIAGLNTRPKAKGRGTLSRHSVQHSVRPIRTFLRWCVGEGYYPADPFSGPHILAS
jgi:site-specific recombinase XerD